MSCKYYFIGVNQYLFRYQDGKAKDENDTDEIEIVEALLPRARLVGVGTAVFPDVDDREDAGDAGQGHVEPKDPSPVGHGKGAADDGAEDGTEVVAELEDACGNTELIVGQERRLYKNKILIIEFTKVCLP